MIVYVDLEHDRLRRYPERYEKSLARRLKHKYRFEEISGDLCLLVRYPRVSPALLQALNARAVLVSGGATDFEHYDEEDLAGVRAVFREALWPTLGLCGGHQLMAQTWGARLDSIGPLPPGAPDDPCREVGYAPGMKQERGFMPVRVTQPHPFFDGLGGQPIFFHSHYSEVKSAPIGFQVFAETDLCAVQMLGHSEQPLFSTQFHPEEYTEAHPDGRRLLENFFRIAAIRTPAE